METTLQVALDVGSRCHRVAVGTNGGELLDEFDVEHTARGFAQFFVRVSGHAQDRPVEVAMEAYNGWARPLDRLILERHWRLFNVNNLKLARYKEMFPAPAKTDVIDARRMLELFRLRHTGRLSREVLQPVVTAPAVNDQLKRLSRRRRQLVHDRVRVLSRMIPDLQACCPGLLELTTDVGNLWFINLLAARDDLRQLARMRQVSLLKIPAIGRKYAADVRAWQAGASFSTEVELVGPMIVADARRILALGVEIKALETRLEALVRDSDLGRRIDSIPGFGLICSAELAGEIGTLERFTQEGSLAMYVGMAPLDYQSGSTHRSRRPRQVNRHAKAAMMVGAAAHAHCCEQAAAYYAKKRSEGKAHNQAVRALGRQLCRVLWSMLHGQREYRLPGFEPKSI